MKNNLKKITLLPIVAVFAFPVFATPLTHSQETLQPYPPDFGNVDITFQTVNQLQPTYAAGPSTYSGNAIISMAVNNNSGDPVDVSCSGTTLNLSICGGQGTDITNCTWTNSTGGAVSLTANGVTSGSYQTASTTISATTTEAWDVAISTTAPLPCTITNTTTNASTTRIFYVPVS